MRLIGMIGLLSLSFVPMRFCSATEAIIATVAGGGQRDPASVGQPRCVAVAENGDLLIADSFDNAILKADSTGNIATVAGGNGADFSGDGNLATKAQLNSPMSVAPDGAGGFLIADLGNNRIRRVDVNGIITTVAGGGPNDFGDGGLATQAQLNGPSGVSSDGAGGFLIVDSGNSRIRRVDAKGIIATVAGNGNYGFSGDGGPATQTSLLASGVASDGAGGFLIADSGNSRIRRVDAKGIIATVAGNGNYGFSGDGGPATQAQLNGPSGVSSDGAGGFLIVDTGNNRIRRVDAHGIITTVAGNGNYGFSGDGGPAMQASILYPKGVSSDGASGFLIVDFGNNRIRRVDASGIISTVAGNGYYHFSGDGGPAVKAQLYNPTGVASDGAGGFLIADTGNSRIRLVDASGIITTVAGNGNYGFSGDGGLATQAQLNGPSGVSSDRAGGFLVADTGNNRIRRVDAHGIITAVAGNGDTGYYKGGFSGDDGPAKQAQLSLPKTVSSDGTGGFFFVDWDNGRIRRVDADGIITTVAGYGNYGFSGDGGPATQAQLNNPSGVASDGAGGFLIADSRNQRIRRVDDKGIITTVAGNGQWRFIGDGGLATQAALADPSGVSSDGAGGFLVADSRNQRIRRVDAKGIITTVAGNGNDGFSGDGGSAMQASLSYPIGMATDGAGGFLIADYFNNRIRRVVGALPSPPTQFLPGDANGDGKINVQDVTMILRFAVGIQKPEGDQLSAADMNGDGIINILDATLAIKKAVGL